MRSFALILIFILIGLLGLKISGKSITFSLTNNHDFEKTTVSITNNSNHNFVVTNEIEQKNLSPNESHIFFLEKGKKMFVGHNIIFAYLETGLLDCEKDTFGQVTGIGRPSFKRNNVPSDIEFAFIIAPPGKGDRDNSRLATPEEIKSIHPKIRKILGLHK